MQAATKRDLQIHCTYFIWWVLVSTCTVGLHPPPPPPHVMYVWIITCWSYFPLNFTFVCQYGRKANDKAAATPLVEHAPGPGKGKKGKKDAKKDKLDDLKQELEMVHNIKRLHVNLCNIGSKKLYLCLSWFSLCYHPPFAYILYNVIIHRQTCFYNHLNSVIKHLFNFIHIITGYNFSFYMWISLFLFHFCLNFNAKLVNH